MMKNKIKFSVIIPVKEINEYIYKSIPHLLGQSYKNFEIIILPDENNKRFEDRRIRIIKTGKIGPADKRDFALKYAKGEILAFIDDDAYPEKNWLEKGLRNFERKEVAAVGGPNLTPENNSKFQKASGYALSTFFVSGSVNYRYKKDKKREIDDFPSCNLFVKKDIFKEISGFDSSYWPGEDTKLCLEIIKKGKKIIYDPEVVVYHHRRKNLNSYLKQIFSYGLHRGHFAKKGDKNSLKLIYFVPSLFLIGLFLGPILFLLKKMVFTTYLFILIIYLILLSLVSLKGKLKGYGFFKVICIIFFTHVIYGFGFIIGLLKKNLKSKLRK